MANNEFSRQAYRKTTKKNKKKRRHWIAWTLSLLAIIIASVVGYEYYKVQSTINTISTVNTDKATIKKTRQGKPISILLMGVDNGAFDRGDTDGNTDTLELITANPKKGTITMTSIPRDTLVKFETSNGTDYAKINAAYNFGGAEKTKKTVSELLNVPINYYAVVNMGVLQKVVDSLGGVEVDNTFAFDFDGNSFPLGKQTLNGSQALAYSRMRYEDPNNDYGRQNRQQQVIQGVINKLKSANAISSINSILDSVKDGVMTDVPLNNATGLYSRYKKSMNKIDMYHLQGLDATINEISFQIASTDEINKVSNLNRTALGLDEETVSNNETELFDSQSEYDGYTNVNFILPDGVEPNNPS